MQICRADVRLVGKRLQAELFPGPRGDELDKAVDDAALGVAGRGQGLRGVGGRLPVQTAQQIGQQQLQKALHAVVCVALRAVRLQHLPDKPDLPGR